MNTTTRIQVEFNEPVAQLEIPVRHLSPIVFSMLGIPLLESRTRDGDLIKHASFNRRSAEVSRFIARIREILQKQEA